MKYLILICFFCCILTRWSYAQESSISWFDNQMEAKTYAAEQELAIMLVFAGSDWCKPCIQFKKDILEEVTFQEWANQRLVVLYLDFPARKKNKLSKEQTLHNEALAEQYNQSGTFPNIILIDAEDKILANPKFKGQSVQDFIKEIEAISKH